MFDNWTRLFEVFLMGIIGLATVAVIFSPQATTGTTAKDILGGIGSLIGSATAPVSGSTSTGLTGNLMSGLGFTTG